MASNVFPMLSSSPPPIDDCPDDDDDDDEFGNFTSANIPFDSSFDSPVAVEKFKFKSGDNGVNNSNFSDEIHKFNSFSNSATPSPQEFVPNFSEENEHSKNGFIPIKHQNSKVQTKGDVDIPLNEKSISCNEANITSHKVAPCTLNSSSDSEHFPPECCDSHQNSSLTSSVKNLENNVTHDIVESDRNFADFDNKPISACDALQEKTEEISLSDESSKQNACDGPEVFASECVTDIQLCKDITEIEKDSFVDESSFSADKFPCDFRSEVCESKPDEFDDHQESESNLSSNQTIFSHKPSDYEYPVSHDNEEDLEDIPVEVCQSSFETKQMTESVNDFSDNEFDDFQSCGEKVVSVQDAENIVLSKSGDFEYDEFQDFQYSSNLKEEVDEFADFQDFSESIIKSSIDTTDGDDFADFSAVPFDSNKTQQSSVCSEFANFEEASFSAPAESSFQASSSSQKSVDTISTVINAIFPLSDSQSDVVSDEVSPQILEQSNKSRRLWEKLHEVEQTPGLRFQWGVSHSFQQLLRSVNVDYHSILRTSSVPIFASGLSLLEPVKGLSNSVNHESEDRNHIPKDPIPPVEFDWNSSGLVNPLDSGQAASTLMDLSFLSSVDTDTSVANNDHSFENELLKPSPTFLCPENSSKTPILEQLLSKNVSSLPNSKITHRPSDLSQEAVRVLDQLPDLSFMQAKVLMFPISSKT